MSINTPAAAGQPRPIPSRRTPVPAPPATTSAACAQDGGTYRGIAAAAGLAPTTVHDLASGRRRPPPAPPPPSSPSPAQAMPRARLDAGGTRLRLRALHVMGHGSARIARAAGVREMTIRELVRGDARPSARSCATRSPPSTTPGGTSAPPNAPAPNAAPPPPPAATRHRRELVRRRRPGRRPARRPRLPAPARLETRHRHRHRPRHPPTRPTPPEEPHMTAR